MDQPVVLRLEPWDTLNVVDVLPRRREQLEVRLEQLAVARLRRLRERPLRERDPLLQGDTLGDDSERQPLRLPEPLGRGEELVGGAFADDRPDTLVLRPLEPDLLRPVPQPDPHVWMLLAHPVRRLLPGPSEGRPGVD